jgi:hypothetical protein
LNIQSFKPLLFTSQTNLQCPPYLASAAESFKARLQAKNIPCELLVFSPGFKDGMPMIDIIAPTEALRTQVLSAVESLEGALPFHDNKHVNFKVARLRITCEENRAS